MFSKLNELLNKWRGAQTDQNDLLSNLIKTLESNQTQRGDVELNALISELKEIKKSDVPGKFPQEHINVVKFQHELIIFSNNLMLNFEYELYFSGLTGYEKVGKIKYNPSLVLGEGSIGTAVYRGYIEKREVAVKRYLKTMWSETAENEADCLIKSDHHPNILQYYCMEKSADFVFLALSLCQTNLQNMVEGIAPNIEVNEIALSADILEGLSHLHNLMPRPIVHRDLKPSNILIYVPHPNSKARGMIADLGLSKQLEDATKETFSTTAGKAKGSRGWQSPEILQQMFASTTSGIRKQLSIKLDIFPTGCLLFFLMTEGNHPFGEHLLFREMNILENRPNLSALEEEHVIYKNLIQAMIAHEPSSRPTAKSALESFKSITTNLGNITNTGLNKGNNLGSMLQKVLILIFPLGEEQLTGWTKCSDPDSAGKGKFVYLM